MTEDVALLEEEEEAKEEDDSLLLSMVLLLLLVFSREGRFDDAEVDEDEDASMTTCDVHVHT